MNQTALMNKLGEEGLLGLSTLSCPEGVDFKLVEEDNKAFLKYGDYKVEDEAADLAAWWGSIPVKFFQRCDPDLRVMLLNKFFKGGTVQLPQAITRDHTILAFAAKGSVIIEPERAIDAILRDIPAPIDVNRIYANGRHIDLYISGATQTAVKVGDLVSAGVFVRFSPFGVDSPEVSAYTLTLSCTNGATRMDKSRKFSMRRDVDPYSWFPIVSMLAYRDSITEVDTYRVASETRLGERASAILAHGLRNLPVIVQNAIMQLAIDAKPDTVWDLMNLVTRYASHTLEDPNLILRTMSAGGELAEHVEFCPSCKKPMN